MSIVATQPFQVLGLTAAIVWRAGWSGSVSDENLQHQQLPSTSAEMAPKKRVLATADKYRYKSQQDPQLTRILLGEQHLWILDGIERHQAKVLNEHGLRIGITTIARNALKSVLIEGRLKFEDVGIPDGIVESIGPFRLPKPFDVLPAAIAKAAKKHGVAEAEVMRSALAQWLIEHGYGPGKKRR